MRVAINSLNQMISSVASENDDPGDTAQMSPMPTHMKDISSKGNVDDATQVKLSFDNLADTEKNLLPLLRCGS